MSYGYNLSGELNSFTNHWGAQVGYGYDKIGRLTNVSGSGYAGVTSYANSLSYRAFGLKQMAYGNGRTLSLQYDNRMRPIFGIAGRASPWVAAAMAGYDIYRIAEKVSWCNSSYNVHQAMESVHP